MATQLWSIILVITAAFLGSLGPVFLKKGSAYVTKDIKSIIFNWRIFIGLCFYGMGTVLFIPALKGGELTVLYPLIATTYIWVSMWSVYLLKERMNKWKWAGIILIIIGVGLIGLGSMGLR